MAQERYDVVIVGAGVVGCATAYYLARAGLRVASLDKGSIAGEASQAGAGMLAPLAESDEDQSSPAHGPFRRLCLAGLQCYTDLDRELQDETGVAIELVKAPLLRPAFDEQEAQELQTAEKRQRHLLPGITWLAGNEVRELEPLLPPTVHGALLSAAEWNVQVTRLTHAYARGAAMHGTSIFEGRAAGRLLQHHQRVVGIETEQGPISADAIVLAAGAWTSQWHTTTTPPIVPVKGQMLALRPAPEQRLRHTLYYHKVGYMLPKADGSIYVGATSERAGFDKTVTIEGIAALLAVVMKLAPTVKNGQFERAWAGLRPGSADDLPLLGPSRSLPGLWIASGHFRNGILLGPLTGQILAELMQGRPAPYALDLAAFDPDRFGGWNVASYTTVMQR
jgi:glycine oxidase